MWMPGPGTWGSPREMLRARATWANSRPSCGIPSSASSATSLLHSRSSASWFSVVTASGSARSCPHRRGGQATSYSGRPTPRTLRAPNPCWGAARPHCPPMERSAQRGPDTRRAMGKLGVPGSPPICTASLRPAAPLLGSEGLTRGQHPLCSANSASVRTPGLSRPQELGRREGRSRPPWGPTRTGPWSPSCRCAGSAGTSLHFSGPQLPRLYSGHGLTPRVIGSDRGVHCKPIPALTALPSSVPAGGGQGSGPPQTALPSAAPPCSTRASARPGRPRSPPYRCRAPHPVEGHSFLPAPRPH